jgi:hypothetical protein
MYDRINSLGKFARRPILVGSDLEELPKHAYGNPSLRKRMDRYLDTPPSDEHYGS